MVIYSKKKENLSLLEQEKEEEDPIFAENIGDRWTFVSIIPLSGYINAVHSGKRNKEQAKIFTTKIKDRSNGVAPLIQSDAWFYEDPISEVYSHYEPVPYSGRGRPRNPIRVVDPNLKYAQIYKKRDKKGRIIEIAERIVIGEEAEIMKIIRETSRNATKINTSSVEGKNGTYRKDNVRLARKTACHSKKALYHDAHIYFLTAVMNFCRENEGLKEEINPDAGLFQVKYKRFSPAMKEGLSDKILSVKELLAIRPKKVLP